MSNINDSGWILCPSKRFPGKFYYYNVKNGASVWSLNETEKNFLRIDDQTQQVSQKWHRYPEPPGLPYRSQGSVTKGTFTHQPFGHVVFPKYISNSTMKWTLNSNEKYESTNIVRPSILRHINSQTFPSERDIVVEPGKEPLSRRISNLNQHQLEIKEAYPESTDVDVYQLREPATKPLKTIEKTGDLQIEKKTIENSSLFNRSNCEDNINLYKSDKGRELNLAENDLRNVLQAKRFKAKEKPDLISTTSKKKVTFNIPHNEDESVDELNRNNRKIVTTKPLTQDKENSLQDYDNGIKNSNSKKSNSMFEIEAHTNLLLQRPKDFNSFLFVKHQDNMTLASSEKHTNKTSADSVYKSEQFIHFRYNKDEIASEDDVSDLTMNVGEKLHIKNKEERDNFGSGYQENPFRIKKPVSNEHIMNSKKSNIVVRIYNSNTFTPLFKYNVENKSHQITEASRFSFAKPSLLSNFTSDSIDTIKTAKSRFKDNIANVIPNSNTKGGIVNFNICRESSNNNTTENIIDHKLKKFLIKYKDLEKSVIHRMDELICCFTQILEDFTCNIIETSSSPPPYSLYDALLQIKTNYDQNRTVSHLVDRITNSHIFSHKTGYIQKDVAPEKLIRTIGCAMLFIEAFKELDVDAGDGGYTGKAGNTGDALSRLLRDMQDPQYEELPEPSKSVARESDSERLINFKKSRTDILRYLQENFPEWKACGTDIEVQNQPEEKNICTNVLRARGKDLHRLKINSQNQLYIEEAGEEKKEENVDSSNTKIIRNFKIIDKYENRLHQSMEEDISIISDNNDKNLYFDDHKNETDNKEFGEFSHYSENSRELNETCIDDARHSNNNNYLEIDDKNDKNNKSVKLNDAKEDISKNNDDGEKDKITVCNETQDALDNDVPTEVSHEDANQYYLLVKIFLKDLSGTLQLIYAFIEESMHRFDKGDITESNKKLLKEETHNTYKYLKDVIEKLKSIVERETRDERTLRTLLAGADGADDDRHVLRYRQVVSKCLEQARLMKSSLQLLLRHIDRDCALSDHSDLCDSTYINIFE